MKKRIIVINGTGGAGKDTFIKYVSRYEKIMNFSTIDRLRESIKNMMDEYGGYNGNWTEEKTDAYRKLLSKTKRIP